MRRDIRSAVSQLDREGQCQTGEAAVDIGGKLVGQVAGSRIDCRKPRVGRFLIGWHDHQELKRLIGFIDGAGGSGTNTACKAGNRLWSGIFDGVDDQGVEREFGRVIHRAGIDDKNPGIRFVIVRRWRAYSVILGDHFHLQVCSRRWIVVVDMRGQLVGQGSSSVDRRLNREEAWLECSYSEGDLLLIDRNFIGRFCRAR